MVQNRDNRPPGCLQQAGIQDETFSSRSVNLREITAATIIRLHTRGNTKELHAALSATGIALPSQTGQSNGHDPAVLCLRPKEYLLCSEQEEPRALLDRVSTLIDPSETNLLNQSDAFATFRLSGTGAPWLLNKLSGLDFQAGTAAGQHCARTRMAHAAVVIHYHQAGDKDPGFVYDLIFDRSLARYIWDLLKASANHADDLAEAFPPTITHLQ